MPFALCFELTAGNWVPQGDRPSPAAQQPPAGRFWAACEAYPATESERLSVLCACSCASLSDCLRHFSLSLPRSAMWAWEYASLPEAQAAAVAGKTTIMPLRLVHAAADPNAQGEQLVPSQPTAFNRPSPPPPLLNLHTGELVGGDPQTDIPADAPLSPPPTPPDSPELEAVVLTGARLASSPRTSSPHTIHIRPLHAASVEEAMQTATFSPYARFCMVKALAVREEAEKRAFRKRKRGGEHQQG